MENLTILCRLVAGSLGLSIVSINLHAAELHSYAGSGHGFGFRPPSTINPQLSTAQKPAAKWIERFEEWLANSGFLKKQ